MYYIMWTISKSQPSLRDVVLALCAKNNAIVEFFIALQHFQMDVFSQGAKSENGYRHMHKQNVKILSKKNYLAKSKCI